MTNPNPLARVLREEITVRPPDPNPADRPSAPAEVPGLEPTADLEWEEVPSVRPDLSAVLPENVALLKVVLADLNGTEFFRLELYWRQRLLVTTDTQMRHHGRPGFMLADELDHGLSPSAATEWWTKLLAWSETKYELANWLTYLRREVGDDLRLIIWDDTDFGIPWELYWHDMGEESAWLGTAVQVVRWTTVHDPRRHHQFSAEESPGTGSRILYYEDQNLVKDESTSISPVKHPGYQPTQSIYDLLGELARATDYGLVYIRGHGEHHSDVLQSSMAGVCLGELSRWKFQGLSQSRAMIFLNACNSARPVIDKSLGDGGNRNFAEVFLRERASGVIATMAETPIEHSAAMARNLIRAARVDGVRVPEFLRAHRERYAKGLPDPKVPRGKPTEQEQRKIQAFMYACMFAYFGHPDSVFRLAES